MSVFKFDKERFEAPTIENDLGRLNEKQIREQSKFVNRANAAYNYISNFGAPPGYSDSLEVYNEISKKNSAGAINFEDLYALDQAISQTVWDSDTFGKLGIPTSTQSVPKFSMKDYLVQSEEWPKFTTKFRNPTFIRLKESSGWSNGVGLHLGISIPFTEIRESQGALWGPQSIMLQELSAKMGIMKSRRGFLGTSCKGAFGDDGSTAAGLGITGLFNASGNQTFETGAAGDDDSSDAGDIEVDLRIMLTDMKKVYQPGKYYIVSTSGYASEPYLHRDTYQQRLDIERDKEILKIITEFQRAGQWGGWWVTDQLYAGTVDSTHQQVMIMKAAPSLINRKIIYPNQMLPMANKDYESDIQENMIFADMIQVKTLDTTNNAVPISIAADVTTTGTGFIPEGTRVL